MGEFSGCIIWRKIQQKFSEILSTILYVKNVTIRGVEKVILINIIRAKNIVQQIQQKYNKIFSIIVNVEKNTLIALPFSVRMFQLIFFHVPTTSRVSSYNPLYYISESFL